MSNKHTETRLQECYENRKKNVVPPPNLQEAILANAKQTKPSIWKWVSWQYAMGIFVAVIIFGWNRNDAPLQTNEQYSVVATYNTDHTTTYYHDVTFLSADQNDVKNIKENAHYQQYLAAIESLKDKRKLPGIVKSIDNEIVIQVCDVGVFQLSREMVNHLLHAPSHSQMVAGKAVYLMADENGFITAIENRDSLQQCPS